MGFAMKANIKTMKALDKEREARRDDPVFRHEAFRAIDVRRKVLIHINNSNPILLDDSPERAAVVAAGWDVAYDGMEIVV